MPAQVHKVLRRCLEKDPAKRLRDIGDVVDLLETGDRAAPAAGSRLGLSGAIIALLFVALAVLAFLHFREKPEERPVFQFAVAAPEKARNIHSFALSPDGRYLAQAASGDGDRQLWLRSLDSSCKPRCWPARKGQRLLSGHRTADRSPSFPKTS